MNKAGIESGFVGALLGTFVDDAIGGSRYENS